MALNNISFILDFGKLIQIKGDQNEWGKLYKYMPFFHFLSRDCTHENGEDINNIYLEKRLGL